MYIQKKLEFPFTRNFMLKASKAILPREKTVEVAMKVFDNWYKDYSEFMKILKENDINN